MENSSWPTSSVTAENCSLDRARPCKRCTNCESCQHRAWRKHHGLQEGALSLLTAVGLGLHFCIPQSKGLSNPTAAITKTLDIFLGKALVTFRQCSGTAMSQESLCFVLLLSIGLSLLIELSASAYVIHFFCLFIKYNVWPDWVFFFFFKSFRDEQLIVYQCQGMDSNLPVVRLCLWWTNRAICVRCVSLTAYCWHVMASMCGECRRFQFHSKCLQLAVLMLKWLPLVVYYQRSELTYEVAHKLQSEMLFLLKFLQSLSSFLIYFLCCVS